MAGRQVTVLRAVILPARHAGNAFVLLRSGASTAGHAHLPAARHADSTATAGCLLLSLPLPRSAVLLPSGAVNEGEVGKTQIQSMENRADMSRFGLAVRR